MPEALKPVDDIKSNNGRSQSAKRQKSLRTTAAEFIYEQLREDIVALRLPPRTALHERQLIERFGFSRTPVREAIIHLIRDGLVEVFPQSGTFIAQIPLDEVPEAIAIRKALEQLTVERAAQRMNASGEDLLEEILKNQKLCAKNKDYNAFHRADEAFHEAVASISGYPGIWKLLKQVKLHMDRYRRLTLPVPGRMERVIREHRKIFFALKRRQVKEARVAMLSHLDAVLPPSELLRARYPEYFK
jgi:GntR family transcriptional regulator, rspAB operon transcriptional repressor